MKTKDRLYELDALRGLAALFVVFHHYTMDRPQSNLFWRTGVMSVDTFFVISGFVIAMSLGASKTAKEFLIRRFFRIYPSFLVCLTITTIILIKFGFEHIGRATLIKYLSNLTFLQTFMGQVSMDGVYWTLTAELWFYLFMVLIFVSRQYKNIERVCMICLAVLCTVGCISRIFPVPTKIITNVYYFGIIILLLPHLIAGIVLYRMKSDKVTTQRYLMLLFCYITVIAMEPYDLRMAYIGRTHFLVTLLGIGGIFILFIKGRLRFIVNPVTMFLGKISYPLYLLHMNIGLLLVLPNIALYTGYWPAALLTIGIMIVAAYLVHVLVEQPMINWAKKKYSSRRENAAVAISPPEPVPALQPSSIV